MMRNPWLLVGAMIVSALLGAGIFAAIQAQFLGGAKGAEIRAYLLDNPEILPEAMERLRAKETAKLEAEQQSAEKKVPANLPALQKPFAGAWAGNPNGDVTVVAFMDYACGYCRASLPGLAELLQKDPNVRVVYREFPVLGPESVVAARWALAAAEQGKFRGFHEALYASDGPSDANIAAAAAKAGLDIARAKAAIGSQPVEAEIGANHRLGQELVMTGTPAWVIGGQLLYGLRDYDGLAAAVAQARKGR
jgi:protein-disulfide isomerase